MTNNKSYIVSAVALVVGLVALVAAFAGHNKPVDVGQSQSLGGVFNVNNVAPTLSAGAEFGTLPVAVNWAGGKIGPGQNVGWWKNTTGQRQYVDYAEFSTDGTASTSHKVYAFSSSTAPRSSTDFLPPVQSQGNASSTLLVNGFTIGTSTTATTTSSDDRIPAGYATTTGSTAIVDNNSYFIFELFTGCPAVSGATCDTASSTRRGFNGQWRLHYHN